MICTTSTITSSVTCFPGAMVKAIFGPQPSRPLRSSSFSFSSVHLLPAKWYCTVATVFCGACSFFVWQQTLVEASQVNGQNESVQEALYMGGRAGEHQPTLHESVQRQIGEQDGGQHLPPKGPVSSQHQSTGAVVL
ncbi:hypothetical protein TYRP_021605 [Tyrophagus putrescentiae]|nr:hypothetical protein TYRP_021605 [Tyrophagus putrescentiae]